MAIRGAGLVTMSDVAKSKDAMIGSVAEVLSEVNEPMAVFPSMVMNEGTSHKEMIRSTLPEVYYRKANQPIPPSKTTLEEFTFQAAHFESKSQMDTAVATRGNNLQFNRWNQAMGHIIAMSLEWTRLLVYGTPKGDIRKVAGLSDVYSSIAAADDVSSQVINMGGSGSDTTSVYCLNLGGNSIFTAYPNNTTFGLTRKDRNTEGREVPIIGVDQNGNSGNYYGYEEQFEIDSALVIKDYRQGARMVNLEKTLASGNRGTFLEGLIKLKNRIAVPAMGQSYYLMNRNTMENLELAIRAIVREGGGITYANVAGMDLPHFRGIPILQTDQILNNETAIT